MKTIFLTLVLTMSSAVLGQIPNGDFESWDTTFAGPYSAELRDTFGVKDARGGTVQHWTSSSGFGVSQTSDRYSGNYSVILHNWYTYANEWITYHDALTSRPQSLQGYFKYVTGDVTTLSQGIASVTLTRFNGVGIDTIGRGETLLDASSAFTAFEVPISYTSASLPDSVVIYFRNATSHCRVGGACNLLYLDKLTLVDGTSEVDPYSTLEDDVQVFPNPAAKELHIRCGVSQVYYFSLYNSLGEKIIDRVLTDSSNVITLSAISTGVYYYELSSAGDIRRSGKLIRQ